MLGPVFLHRILTFICVQGFAEVWIGTSFEKDGASKTWSASCTDLDSETLRTGSVRCVSLWLKFVKLERKECIEQAKWRKQSSPEQWWFVNCTFVIICTFWYVLLRFFPSISWWQSIHFEAPAMRNTLAQLSGRSSARRSYGWRSAPLWTR